MLSSVLLNGILGFFILKQAPVGNYVGSKTVFGETIDATVAFHDSSVLDFAISGAFVLDCSNEAYQLVLGNVVLRDIDVAGDCAHDALDANGVDLTKIVYNDATNQITVSVKYSVAKIDIVLSPENTA